MKVKLLKNIYQAGSIKITTRENRKESIAWFEGTEIEVSDATGEKLIASGDAVAVKTGQVQK